MIVIGADTHKRSHTVAAVDTATGRMLGEQTVSARQRSFEVLLIWARGHAGDRVWAIEDCRHVSGCNGIINTFAWYDRFHQPMQKYHRVNCAHL